MITLIILTALFNDPLPATPFRMGFALLEGLLIGSWVARFI